MLRVVAAIQMQIRIQYLGCCAGFQDFAESAVPGALDASNEEVQGATCLASDEDLFDTEVVGGPP